MNKHFFPFQLALIIAIWLACVPLSQAKGLHEISMLLPQVFTKHSIKHQIPALEGEFVKPTVTVGPFDLHRKYRSMEGPYVDVDVNIGDIVESGGKVVSEGLVRFVENGGQASMAAQASAESTIPDSNGVRRLFWLKGVKLELLDENDKVLPTAEFFCHLNIDVDPKFRDAAFPEGEHCTNSRLFTLTQGQTEMMFPKGFGVPLASDEKLRCIFQAANRTTIEHRRIKQRLTIFLIPDDQLIQPITALNWFTPYMTVVVDKNTQDASAREKMDCSMCASTSRGVAAPNSVENSIESDRFGRRVSGHWVIPPGKNVWTTKIRDYAFDDKPRVAHFIWSHVHPLCTSFSLVELDDGARKDIATVHCKSKVNPGLQIEHIDLLSSVQGIRLEAHKPYELEIFYDNPTDQGQDSMATMGIFCENNDFARPQWALSKANSLKTCGVNGCSMSDHQNASSDTQTNAPAMPIFSPIKDGPLLTNRTYVDLKTSVGNLHIILQPRWSPLAATQLANLFKNHCFDGTPFYRLDEYLIQLSVAESKAPGFPGMPAESQKLLRRIPVELGAPQYHLVSHRPGVLSMARETNDPYGNASSFSIMLKDWPELDTQFTIFGEVADDSETKATIEAIKAAWRNNNHPNIITSELAPSVASGR